MDRAPIHVLTVLNISQQGDNLQMLRLNRFQAGAGAIALVPLALASYILVFTRVPQPTADNTYVVSGQISQVKPGGRNDVVIRLKGDDRIYYINRGLERGIELGSFANKLQGQQVKLQVIERAWTPLDPYHRLAPVASVARGVDPIFPAP